MASNCEQYFVNHTERINTLENKIENHDHVIEDNKKITQELTEKFDNFTNEVSKIKNIILGGVIVLCMTQPEVMKLVESAVKLIFK